MPSVYVPLARYIAARFVVVAECALRARVPRLHPRPRQGGRQRRSAKGALLRSVAPDGHGADGCAAPYPRLRGAQTAPSEPDHRVQAPSPPRSHAWPAAATLSCAAWRWGKTTRSRSTKSSRTPRGRASGTGGSRECHAQNRHPHARESPTQDQPRRRGHLSVRVAGLNMRI